MKLNEDLLVITPISPLDAKEHMELYREGRNYLDNYLEVGESFHLYTFKYHAKLLLGFYRSPADYPVYAIKYGKRLIGMFHFSPPKYIGGVQMVYYIRPKYQGKGIATFALKYLSNIAFYTHKYLHIELHIDVDNIGSKKAAEKAGFESGFDYVDDPIGAKGSGNMEIYILVNNLPSEYVRQIPRESWMENEEFVPGGRNFTPRFNHQPNRNIRRLIRRR
jgi:RimJ/RimL family protein N-acetyltransferase